MPPDSAENKPMTAIEITNRMMNSPVEYMTV
jgi:hypothetical protein